MRTTVSRLLLTAVLVVAGCADPEPPPSFTYWSMWREEEPQAFVLSQAIAAFTRDTGVVVHVRWQDRDVLKDLDGAFAADEVPDLVDQKDSLVRSSLVATDRFHDLAPVYDAKVPVQGHKVSTVIDPRYAKALTEGGRTFMIPYEVLALGLWFDAGTLPDVVEHPPTTWAGFKTVLAKRKAAGRTPLALDSDRPFYNASWTIGVLQAALGPGAVARLAQDRTGQAWADVRVPVAEVADLVAKKYFRDGQWPAGQDGWARGQADFLLMGSWAPSETQRVASKDFSYRFLPLPGEQRAIPVGTIGFAVPRGARHSAEAEKFIAYFMKDLHLSRISTVAMNLTPNPELPVPDYLQSLAGALKGAQVTLPLDGVDGLPGYVEEVLYPANDLLLSGALGVDGFLADITRRQAGYWEVRR